MWAGGTYKLFTPSWSRSGVESKRKEKRSEITSNNQKGKPEEKTKRSHKDPMEILIEMALVHLKHKRPPLANYVETTFY